MNQPCHLIVGHVWTAVWNPSLYVCGIIESLLTFKESVYVGGMHFDQPVPLFSYAMDGSIIFRSGVLQHVYAGLVTYGCVVTIHDQRDWILHAAGDQYAGELTAKLYPDQLECVRRMVDLKRGVVNLATNAGKTWAAAVYWHVMGRPSMLVLTPSKTLVFQLADDIEEICGLKKGTIARIGGDQSGGTWAPVTVSTIVSADNLVRSKGQFHYPYSILIADEGDTFTSARADRITDALHATPHRFWMTGTAFKNRAAFDWKIISLAGPLVATVTNRDLIEAGRSKRPVVCFVDNDVKFVDGGGSALPGADEEDGSGDYQALYKKHITKNRNRAELTGRIIDECVDSGLTVLAFTELIEHANLIAEHVDSPVVITGQHGIVDHRNALQELKSGGPACVIATGTWRRGLSIPAIDVVINAASGKSASRVMQQFGRLLRISEKQVGWYVDFRDRGSRVLFRHGLARAQMFAEQGIIPHLWRPWESEEYAPSHGAVEEYPTPGKPKRRAS